MVATKTLYTLVSANQNSIYMAGLPRETLYALRQFEPKLYTLCPFGTKTLYTLSHRWATMIAPQVLKKVAP
jgi:hypothetical protein